MPNDSLANSLSGGILGIEELRTEIDLALANFLTPHCEALTAIGSELLPVAKSLSAFTLDSGKRFRPLLATLGYLATGKEINRAAIATLSSLELVHVCALIHDDVMDQSDSRRGAPTIHRIFEEIHSREKLHGDAANYGVASAILLGDLALVWAGKMSHSSGLEVAHLAPFLAIFDEMQSELMAGQFLDIHEQALGSQSVERSLKVARYKSAKYSIERPLHSGVALALHDDAVRSSELLTHFSNFGLPLGEAFQLRDDVLGVYGESASTGKPVGDDLREGKRTALLAFAHTFANPAQKDLLDTLVGNPNLTPHQVEQLQHAIDDSGALQQVENLITQLTEESISALHAAPIESHARELLEQMAIRATQRKS